MVLLMLTLLKQQECQAGAMEGSGKDGAITLGDSRRVRIKVLYDILEFVLRWVLKDAGALTVDKRATLTGLMRELVK